jgi:protein subunit release factor A
MSIILEIRAAEGGQDAKLLVEDQMRVYIKRCTHHGL